MLTCNSFFLCLDRPSTSTVLPQQVHSLCSQDVLFKMPGSELTGKWINGALAEVEKATALQSDALVGAALAEVHAG